MVAEERYPGVAGGRPYGVTSVHACDDGSRVAVSGEPAEPALVFFALPGSCGVFCVFWGGFI